ncbi:MAG: hypothetical protein ACYSPI_12925 [Planctomycetota bacterium]|jgi:hypothetical protein
MKTRKLLMLLVLAIGIIFGIIISQIPQNTAIAKPHKVDGGNYPEGRIPQKIKNGKYPRTYYPNTEKLASDEMRITAIGTGMPNQSPSNVAACLNHSCSI